MPYADPIRRREYIREYMREYRAANPEKARALALKHHNKHKEKRLAGARDWKKRHRVELTAMQRRRHCAKLQRTPGWADLDAVREVYAEAARISRETGIPHEVDHILPLQGRLVSGLHVAANLRVVTQRENRSKGNRLE